MTVSSRNLLLCSLCSLCPVEEIVKQIQDFNGLQALRLEGNTIGVEAAQAIAKALETKSEFKVLIPSLAVMFITCVAQWQFVFSMLVPRLMSTIFFP